MTRRSLLQQSVLVRSALAAVPAADFKSKLVGPVCSVPTVYNADYSLDLVSIKKIVDCGLQAGAQTFALTAGNSQYDRLTYDEIKTLTTALVKAVNGRGLVIAATGQWWTGQAVDYARFASQAGADAVQVFLPAFGNDDTLYDHFAKIAAASRCGIVLHGQVPFPLLKRVLALETVVAYKEEYPPLYSVELFAKYRDRLNIFAGGQKSRYLMFQPHGMKAYYSTFSTFAPSIPQRFWKASQAGRTADAIAVVDNFDVPFFSRFSHAFWRATLEHFGTAQRYLRPPEAFVTPPQMADVKAFYRTLGM